MTTYSDWRTLRFIDCHACGAKDAHTRDAPGGLEVDCPQCGVRSTLAWTPELSDRFERAQMIARARPAP
jgi:hypothetical protein